MKILKLFIVAILLMGMGACATMNQSSSLTPQTPTNTTAYTAGAACGSALLALYTQYKTDGKIDLTNPTNLLHLATLAGSSSQLKANSNNKPYFQDFAKGTISGSRNAVTASITNKLLNSLSTVNLSSLKQQSTKVSQTTEAVSSVVNLLNLLKQ